MSEGTVFEGPADGPVLPAPDEACASCKSPERVQSEYVFGGAFLRNDYCGACGATWGFKTKEQSERDRARKERSKNAGTSRRQQVTER
jgi:hypothetical protein